MLLHPHLLSKKEYNGDNSEQCYLVHFSLMELNKLRENLVTQYPLLVPENYIMKPYNMKDEFVPFEAASSSKGYLQDFHHLDEFNVNGSSSNPMFGTQTPYFNPYDTNYNYEGSNSTDHLNFYECKPLADQNGGHGQVLDNFQSGGYLNFPGHLSSNPLTDMMGPHHRSSTTLLPSNCQEIKPMNFVVPDEVSCIKSENGYMNNRSRSSGSSVTRGTYKGRKKSNVVKGQWTIEEDRLLIQLVDQYGVRKWSHIAQMLPGRIGKQCRERWHNHLRPDIKKDTWSEEEDKVLIEAHAEIGNKWAEIAKRLAGRTENSIKNHWNATKRRQYSKRKCRSKYPRGSLLQEYIKSLNLDSSPNTGRGQRKNNSNSAANNNATSSSTNKAVPPSQPEEDMGFCGNDRLVPNYELSEDPASDFCFDDNIFEQGCSIESLLDDIPCAPFLADDESNNNSFDGKMLMPAAAAVVSDVDDDKSFGMDIDQVIMESQVKKELDLVEMFSQVNQADA